MEIIIHEESGRKIAEATSDSIFINREQDALDLMVDPKLQGARRIILHQANINPDFFRLGTGIAGQILQKFVTYRVGLAIVGDFSTIPSGPLKDFIYESNKGREIFFCQDVETAKRKLFEAS